MCFILSTDYCFQKSLICLFLVLMFVLAKTTQLKRHDVISYHVFAKDVTVVSFLVYLNHLYGFFDFFTLSSPIIGN